MQGKFPWGWQVNVESVLMADRLWVEWRCDNFHFVIITFSNRPTSFRCYTSHKKPAHARAIPRPHPTLRHRLCPDQLVSYFLMTGAMFTGPLVACLIAANSKQGKSVPRKGQKKKWKKNMEKKYGRSRGQKDLQMLQMEAYSRCGVFCVGNQSCSPTIQYNRVWWESLWMPDYIGSLEYSWDSIDHMSDMTFSSLATLALAIIMHIDGVEHAQSLSLTAASSIANCFLQRHNQSSPASG